MSASVSGVDGNLAAVLWDPFGLEMISATFTSLKAVVVLLASRSH